MCSTDCQSVVLTKRMQHYQCAALAREGGYDGVEVMGSEGYLINQVLEAR